MELLIFWNWGSLIVWICNECFRQLRVYFFYSKLIVQNAILQMATRYFENFLSVLLYYKAGNYLFGLN